MFNIMVMVIFQSIFSLKIHQNNFLFYFNISTSNYNLKIKIKNNLKQKIKIKYFKKKT
jgi:phosphoribosylpyrophosphate synthetase